MIIAFLKYSFVALSLQGIAGSGLSPTCTYYRDKLHWYDNNIADQHLVVCKYRLFIPVPHDVLSVLYHKLACGIFRNQSGSL